MAIWRQRASSPAALTSLQSQVTSLQSQVLDNRMEARTGIAVALAAGFMPALQPGRKFALSAGYGNFEGASAFGIGATALLYDGKKFAIVGNVGGAVGLERSAGGGRGAVYRPVVRISLVGALRDGLALRVLFSSSIVVAILISQLGATPGAAAATGPVATARFSRRSLRANPPISIAMAS